MLVLLVEDNPAEARLTQEALRETGFVHELHIVSDGEKATQFLHRQNGFANAATPGIVLLDLNLPRKSGREVLREMKSDPSLCSIPVIVISNSISPDDVNDVYRLNGNCYLVKPQDLDSMFEMVRTMVDFWFRKAQLPEKTGENFQPLHDL